MFAGINISRTASFRLLHSRVRGGETSTSRCGGRSLFVAFTLPAEGDVRLIRPISAWARSYRADRTFEALASILVPSMLIIPSLRSASSRASINTYTNAVAIASALIRRKVAIVSWSGCVSAATKRTPHPGTSPAQSAATKTSH